MNKNTTTDIASQEDLSEEGLTSDSGVDQVQCEWKAEEQRARDLLKTLGVEEGHIEQSHWCRIFQLAQGFQGLDACKRGWVDGVAPVEHFDHDIRMPNAVLAGLFQEAALKAHPGLDVISAEQMAESLDDIKVLLYQDLQANSQVMTETMVSLDAIARMYGGHYEFWELVGPNPNAPAFKEPSPDEFRRAMDERKRRFFKMRTEFLGDALIARLTLAPYVVEWHDFDSLTEYTGGVKTSVCSGMGHEVEFEVCEGGPTLDQLRWKLWQVTDLHVAAQTLNYADKYDGERLDYRIMDRLSVSEEYAAKFQERQAAVERQIESINRRREPLLTMLQAMTGAELDLED